MINEEILKRLSVEKIKTLIEKKRELKKFKTVKQLKEELRERIKSEKQKRRGKAGIEYSKEKMLEKGKEIEKEKRIKKKQMKEENDSTKLTRQMKLYIDQVLSEKKSEIVETFENVFKEEVKKLSKDGLFYSCEYLTLSMDEIAKRGIKNLGAKGWIYSFELNGKIVFRRIAGGKND